MFLADIFGTRNRPPDFRVLPCLGIVQDKLHSRFGFIYQPPTYIEKYKAFSKDKSRIIKPCLPVILLKHLGNGLSDMLPLGERFDLARKLTRSLYVMHAAGWIHKK